MQKKDNQQQETLRKVDSTIQSQFSGSVNLNDISPEQMGVSIDDRELLFMGQYKNPNEKTKSIYSTGELQGIAFDASCRVMAQLPTGRYEALNSDDHLNAMAMNLLLEHYIIPNANRGGNYLIKARQINMYSRVYGTMFAFYDWRQTDEYIGPDMRVIHPRRVCLQPGRYMIDDMDYIFIEVDMTLENLKDRAEMQDSPWKYSDDLKSKLKDVKKSPSSQTQNEKTAKDNADDFTAVYKFSKNGDLVVFEKTTNIELLNEKKYYPCIPIVDKRSIPLIDRAWDLCDFERGHTVQKGMDTLTRTYLDTVQMALNPPLKMDPEQVVLSSIVRQPSANWFFKNGNNNAVQEVQVNTQGLSTYQVTHDKMKANLLSLGATTDTTVSKTADQGFGKTPQALKQQEMREGARDNWDRYMQEDFMRRSGDMMYKLVQHFGIDSMEITGISGALKKLQERYPDKEIDSYFAGEGGKYKVSEDGSKKFKDVSLRYIVDAGSTRLKEDAGGELLEMLIGISKNPAIMEDMKANGQKIKWGEVVKKAAIDRGVHDWDDVIGDIEKPESVEDVGGVADTVEIPEQEVPQEQIPQEQLMTQ